MPGTPLNVHTSWTMVCNSITILLRVAAARGVAAAAAAVAVRSGVRRRFVVSGT